MARKQKEKIIYDSDWYYEDEESQDLGEDLNWDDFIENLKYSPQNEIQCGFIAIGYVHTWRGHFIGYSKSISYSDSLLDVIKKLVSDYDRVKIFFNENGDLELALYHHDGTNRVVIRQLKSQYQDDYYFEKIMNDLYNQKDTSAYKYTKSVKYIFKGWIF